MSLQIVSLFDEVSDEEEYVITAGKNRTGRILYLYGYEDCTDWDISICPKVYKGIKRASDLKLRAEKEQKGKKQSSIIKGVQKELVFTIEKYNSSKHNMKY